MTGARPGAGKGPSLLMVATVSDTIRAFLRPYAAQLRAQGWRVHAAANGIARDRSLAAGFDAVHELPLSRSLLDLRGLALGRRALGNVLETPFDIVHVHTPIAGFLTRQLVSRLPQTRRPSVVYTAHGFHFYRGGDPVTNALFRTAERVAGRWTDRLIVMNDEDEQAARRHRLVPAGRLVRMPGIGLDTDHYAPDAVDPGAVSRVRDELEIPVDAPLFAIIGELTRRKRQADAVAALGRLDDPKTHLLLAGSGPERPALERDARNGGAGHRVHFLGVVEDVRPIVLAATAVMLPSSREGLARSVMEALALEVPVIASTARGNEELVGTDAGLVYETGDIAALARAMDWMIRHPDRRREMGARGRARMVGTYDLRVLLRLHEALYRELLETRRST